MDIIFTFYDNNKLSGPVLISSCNICTFTSLEAGGIPISNYADVAILS
jgi:hypothetical protein